MIFAALLPWLLGLVALGVGCLCVGGSSILLLAFVIPALIVGLIASLVVAAA